MNPVEHVGERFEEMTLEVFLKDKVFLNYFFDESFAIKALRENGNVRLKMGSFKENMENNIVLRKQTVEN